VESLDETTQVINLSRNALCSLRGVEKALNLVWANFSENRISSVSLELFSGMKRLKTLNLSKNKIQRIEYFSGGESLRTLLLNDNEIVSIGSLAPLTRLGTLVLSKNKLESLPGIKDLTVLRKLSLSHNSLQSLPAEIGACLELRELRINHNRLTALPESLAQLKNLKLLDLGSNLFEDLNDLLRILKSLPSLKHLSLWKNPLTRDPLYAQKVLKALPGVSLLDFSHGTQETAIPPQTNSHDFENKALDEEEEGDDAMDFFDMIQSATSQKVIAEMQVNKFKIKEFSSKPKVDLEMLFGQHLEIGSGINAWNIPSDQKLSNRTALENKVSVLCLDQNQVEESKVMVRGKRQGPRIRSDLNKKLKPVDCEA
jgi:Leucine-rich repeat (LRR) protein